MIEHLSPSERLRFVSYRPCAIIARGVTPITEKGSENFSAVFRCEARWPRLGAEDRTPSLVRAWGEG